MSSRRRIGGFGTPISLRGNGARFEKTIRRDGSSWQAVTHESARSRAYRWGEDGLLGIYDKEGRLCFAVSFWNGRDSTLKERLFGLAGPEGNHGEDVKEAYY